MPPSPEETAVRRAVVIGGLAVVFSQFAFGVVYGLGARDTGLSLLEALAMSAVVYAGSAQFAALGMLATGAPWAAILVVTALINARHLLYSASLAPWFTGLPRHVRAIAAHPLTDEAYALTLPAFQRLGRLDLRSYGLAALLTFPTWVFATLVGHLGGELMPDPRTLGLDVVFPAVMGGLAVALVTDRRTLVAALVGATAGVAAALALGATVGVLLGGIAGPLVASLVPAGPARPGPQQEAAFVPPPDGMPG